MKSLVDRLSRYVPVYATVVRGYEQERIDALEAALGRALPAPYRDFLETVAANIGFSTGDVRFDIDAVIQLVADREPLPEHLVPIAADEGTSYCDFYLDYSHPHGADDALVIRIPAGARITEQHMPIFWSFRDFLFSWAFTDVRMAAFAEKTSLLWEAGEARNKGWPSPEAVTEVMEKLGFEPLAETSPAAQLYERGDCAGSIYQVPFQDTFSLALAARDRSTLVAVVEVLRDTLPPRSP